MSETDRAFIRAYQQQCAAPPSTARRTTHAASYPAGAPQASPTTQLRVDMPQAAPSAVAGGLRVPTPHLQISASGPAWRVMQPPGASATPSRPQAEAVESAADEVFTTTSQVAAPPGPSPWGRRTPTPAAMSISAADVQRENIAAAHSPLRLHLGIEQTLQLLEGHSHTEIEAQAATLDAPQHHLSIVLPSVEEREDMAGAEQTDMEPEYELESLSTSVTDQSPAATAAHDTAREPRMAEEFSITHENSGGQSLATSATAPEPVAIQPQWEVDAFQWPTLVDRLAAEAHEAIVAACETLAAAAADGQNVLAVTGVEVDCGATTLALTLARHLAAGGLRVALVDADFDNPVLAQRLGIRAEEGWEATLEGRLPVDEVCIASVDDNLVLAPLVAGEGVSSTMASMNAAGQLEKLRQAFDMVIIDAGSGSENVAAVATTSDEVLDVVVLLAVDQRGANPADTHEVIARLRHNGLHRVRLAETFVSF